MNIQVPGLSKSPDELIRLDSRVNTQSPSSYRNFKLPSGSISILKKGTELRLRPSSPQRYTISFYSKKDSPEEPKHIRSSTVSPRPSKFIAANELISLQEHPTPESEALKISDESLSSYSLEDEPQHSIAYVSPNSNKNSLIASTTDLALGSLASTPLSDKIFNLYTLNAYPLHPEKKISSKKFSNTSTNKHYSYENQLPIGRVYCGQCQENVVTKMQFKMPAKTL
jgi:hypothetical protein